MMTNPELEEISARLRLDPIFSQLPRVAFARLLPHIVMFESSANNIIVSAGDDAEFFFFVIQGQLLGQSLCGKIYHFPSNRSGDEVIVGFQKYTLTLIAKADSKIIKIPRKEISTIVSDYPGIIKEITDGLITILSEIQTDKDYRRLITDLPSVSNKEIYGWGVAIALPLVVLYLMIHSSIPIKIAYFSVLLLAAACLWVFDLVDEFIPPIFVIAATISLALVPANIALKGFGSESLLLFVGIYALGVVLENSGVFYRYMLWLLNKIPDSLFWQRLLLIISGYLISPVISSGNSRLAILLPMFREMTECLGLARKSIAGTSLATATFSGAMLMSPMFLTSKPSNLVVIGLLPGDVKDQFSSFYWFFAAIIPAIVVTIGHFVADYILYGKVITNNIPYNILRKQIEILGPLTSSEWASIGCLIFFIGGATTNKWHHLSMAQISALLLVCLLIYGLVTKSSFQKKIDWSMIFFLLSLDGLTSIMSYLHISDYLLSSAPEFLSYLRNNDFLFVIFEFFVVCLIRLILPTTAGMITSALLLIPLAPAIGVSAWVIGFLSSLFSDIWLFPYQSSVYTQFRNKEGGRNGRYDETVFIKHNLILNLARLIAAFISIPYWTWLGLI